MIVTRPFGAIVGCCRLETPELVADSWSVAGATSAPRTARTGVDAGPAQTWTGNATAIAAAIDHTKAAARGRSTIGMSSSLTNDAAAE
ncbi:MAG: hypothetical protein J0L91_05155 [Burkholderiales bacterium]|nr:hypothetical protein [Burkholderiales bacterium]MCC7116792.1 hypothetical protein [Burkholderiales bacterium]